MNEVYVLKVLIIYFSQSGSTEKIAKMIQNGIIKSGNDCDLEKIKNVNLKSLEDYDLIGIGTPTFFYREPVNVKLFISRLGNLNGKHCFIFATHGSIIGNTFYYMDMCGSDALPIVTMICFLMGLILGFQGAIQLHKFGTDIYLADGVGLSIVKELGPLMVAMIATGRAGSAFAAEIVFS